MTKKALKKQVQFRDNEIEYFELRNGALENELEAYRFMYIKAEDERLYLDNQYNSIKKTVIREFKTIKRLKARNKELERIDYSERAYLAKFYNEMEENDDSLNEIKRLASEVSRLKGLKEVNNVTV